MNKMQMEINRWQKIIQSKTRRKSGVRNKAI